MLLTKLLFITHFHYGSIGSRCWFDDLKVTYRDHHSDGQMHDAE